MTSPLDQPSTPTHQKIPNPLLRPPGAPRKPRTLLRWVQRSQQDSLDLRDYYLGLPKAHDLDLDPGTPNPARLPRGGEEECPSFDDLLPAFAGPLFTTPLCTDFRGTGDKKRRIPDWEGTEGKKRRHASVPSFSISCSTSLLELEDAPQVACPAPATPTPPSKPIASPAYVPTTPPSSASTRL